MTKSMPIVRTFRAASKSTPRTYHGLAMPSAASNNWFCILGPLLPRLNAAQCRIQPGSIVRSSSDQPTRISKEASVSDVITAFSLPRFTKFNVGS